MLEIYYIKICEEKLFLYICFIYDIHIITHLSTGKSYDCKDILTLIEKARLPICELVPTVV